MSVPTKTMLDAYALIRELTFIDSDGRPLFREGYVSIDRQHLDVIRKAHASAIPAKRAKR